MLSARDPGAGNREEGHEEQQITSSLELGTQQVKLKAHGAALQGELDICVHVCGDQRPSSGTIRFVFESVSFTGLEPTNWPMSPRNPPVSALKSLEPRF